MPSGYEQSRDYDGPPRHEDVILLIALVVTAVLVLYSVL
jgi:hypothetical protein